MMQDREIYLQLKRNMQKYNKDFNGALQRAEEIAEDERRHAELEISSLEVLDGFGVVL